jgi:undecaprenyldiphospho-muramoylpentapeptide beta-N-acetylglucosaminyltransferase
VNTRLEEAEGEVEHDPQAQATVGAPAAVDATAPTGAWAVVAGGGTAGHVVPGLAVAEALVALGHERSSLLFVGSERGMEAELVPAAGFRLALLPGRGIQRRATLANVGAVLGILRGVVQGARLVRRTRPSVVVSLGGYASVPCVVGAAMRRIPIVAVSYDAVPGVATRLAGRFAKANAVAFADSPLPRPVLTGTPVGAGVVAVDPARDRARARAELGLPADATVVLVVGGSLGAARLNEAVLGFVATHVDRAGLAIRHVCGTRNAEEVTAKVPPPVPGGLVYQCVPYEDRMPLAYAAADLVVARSGAVTVAELAVVGLPAVLVPYPHATHDHQTANARSLERAGAAVVVPDGELDAARFASVVDELLADPERRRAMAAAAAERGRPDAAARVAVVVEGAARPVAR